jgi:hypothetical protein
MDNLIQYFSLGFYADPISFLLAIIGLYISWNKRIPPLNIFKFFFSAYIITKLINYFAFYTYDSQIIKSSLALQINHQVDFIYTIIEYGIFVWLLKNSINKKVIIATSIFFAVCALSIYLYQMIYFRRLYDTNVSILFLAQALSLLIICSSYFIKIFREVPNLILLNEPNFWIATGICFFMISTLPFTVYCYYLIKYERTLAYSLFAIFFTFYSILFVMFIRAMLCKPKKVQ